MRLDADQLHELAELVAAAVQPRERERFLTKSELAGHLGCSARSIEGAMQAGMPHAIVFGRAKFKPSEVEPWLERHGHLEHRNGTSC